ncbi:UDP-N-acetylmuramoyl-tripeptide--D-alanyl-D-alanine ligase [Treponema socranskii subsp. socranskii VPI DR56BR1116 = ATCC 35536]|uniref:UDP-N-acetylmuramoyl-tripeptide--D-alanyl-D-alanine ligase n=1 Tax=Treponema socranskii subsp. socranskii VPI DR56BR1116 = ATCC 35536 TaxID=1125725 RepID=U1FJX1_TRESO|nr:UDP-N-acetylmuramoyl-tripeptide--D-alanyl-D-alanine ligase [Treponema socranskii]ERF59631.1 UDP-N-acetylmuramoyl-tripeptide--D-alanyl-D-alanine ligase [Treponema socranskii subsp. socranskii VPI DR56BR1116 = ATCC 35536]ERK04920.1 UDP-N-acetylmuramoyl-tripeptide--D-alanyl-D-alanine ligase [Treponema socranskii subsp. socranskii VPI DR56BR1116 = ATCC 35536]
MERSELVAAVRGKGVGHSAAESRFCFSSVTTDSRLVVPGSLFVPLVGTVQNGHAYISESLAKGASVVFINESEYSSDERFYLLLAEKYPLAFFVIVSDTLYALQDAAAAYVAKFPRLKKIGITGSSGKTTTKELVAAVLKQKYRVVSSDGNFNSETGLPLSVFKIRDTDEIGVFEMGMNRPNEIGEIARVLKPQYALITNIGSAHIGILGSKKNIAAEKRKIFDYVPSSGAAFVPASDAFAPFLIENCKGQIVYFGNDVAEKSGASLVSDDGLAGTVFSVGGERVHFKLPGMYNYENALAAVAVGKYFGVSDAEIKTALSSFGGVSGRSESGHIALKNGKRVTLVKDCYNANAESTASVLSFCASAKDVERKIYVLGDMLELGDVSRDVHEKAGRDACKANAYKIVFIGTEMKYAYDAALASGFTGALYIAGSSSKAMSCAADFILANASDGDLLLLKGSRGMALERIVPLITAEGCDA